MDATDFLDLLHKLEQTFQEYENKVYENIAYLRKHNHDIEAEALRYKAEAYCKCKLDVFDMIDKF